MAQEELAANLTHQAGLESQVKELQTGRASLEQELAKQNQKLQQQEQNLRELQKQQVRHATSFHFKRSIFAVVWPFVYMTRMCWSA